ncbi:MAG: hypothetical protein AAGG72_00035 [Pseudomonadota bacterium]
MKRRRVRIRVTDHAVIRYMERGLGINVAMLRAHIAGLAENGAELGAHGIKRDGFKIVAEDVETRDMTEGQMVVIPTILEDQWLGEARGVIKHKIKSTCGRKAKSR